MSEPLLHLVGADVLAAARPTCQASEQLGLDCDARASWAVRLACPCGTEIALVCFDHEQWLLNQDITCPDCGFEVTPTGRERF